MACITRTCFNQDNWRPGINMDIARALRKSSTKGCKGSYTSEEVKALKDELVCTLQDSKSALHKYTLNIYIMILSSAIHSRSFCDNRIKFIKDALERTDC
jgi:hypothetical protein